MSYAHIPRTCPVCHKDFVYMPAGKDKGRMHLRGLFCSSACRSKSIADSKPAKAPAFCPVVFGRCARCGKGMATRTAKQYCGHVCRNKDVAELLPMATVRKCTTCGSSFTTFPANGRPTDFCQPECKAEADRNQARIHNKMRKAKERGATVERVDPLRVFRQANWVCQLCGILMDPAHRGTHRDDAPELDHIIPIAKGGAHSYANTQCACRRCNGEKSDTMPVEYCATG